MTSGARSGLGAALLLKALWGGLAFGAGADSLAANDSTTTTVILVRHAERDNNLVGGDPPLSAAGFLRAQALRHALEGSGIAAIYVTPYLRNRQTAMPLATALGESLTVVDPIDATVQRLRTRHPGQKVLVVGHSNTIPQIVSALCHRPFPNDRVAYDGMWVVTIAPDGRTSLLTLRYGAKADTPIEPSPPPKADSR